MRLTSLLLATAALMSMIAAPAVAQPVNAAAKLSLANGANTVRAGAPTKKSSKALAGAFLLLLGLAVTATVVGVAVGTSHSDHKAASA